jgi:hypothetical protein
MTYISWAAVTIIKLAVSVTCFKRIFKKINLKKSILSQVVLQPYMYQCTPKLGRSVNADLFLSSVKVPHSS